MAGGIPCRKAYLTLSIKSEIYAYFRLDRDGDAMERRGALPSEVSEARFQSPRLFRRFAFVDLISRNALPNVRNIDSGRGHPTPRTAAFTQLQSNNLNPRWVRNVRRNVP